MKLYTILAGVAITACGLAGADAQMHAVRKPEAVVRALGVYEWTGEEAKPDSSRLVPVSLFIDGQLQDAGVYLARPVPFVLDRGTLFELQHAGVPEGLVEVESAAHVEENAGVQFDDGWLGYGLFQALPKPKLVASNSKTPGRVIPLSVNGKPSDSSRPTMVNRTGSSESKPASTEDPDRPTMVNRTGSSESKPASTEDPDRPTMRRRTESGTATDSASPNSPPSGDADGSNDTADRPTLRKRSEQERKDVRKQRDQASVRGVGNLNDDPDRPTLTRTTQSAATVRPLLGMPTDLHQRVAISDAANRSAHDFARSWESEAERKDVLARMEAFAREQLTGYAEANGTAPASTPPVSSQPASPATASTKAPSSKATSPKATSSRPAGHTSSVTRRATPKTSTTAQPPVLTQEALHGYTLSYGGTPTYVLEAQSPGANGSVRFVTVVAQEEPGSGLHVAEANVTDSQHLDRAPQWRLLDAVDAEASNRASLLFELRAQGSRQFCLLRVIGAEAKQIFTTGSTD